jgi:hypothetical protein
VSEGEDRSTWRWGDGSPGSREAEGEGGEGFYITQSGRSPDLLVIKGGGANGDGEKGWGISDLLGRASEREYRKAVVAL